MFRFVSYVCVILYITMDVQAVNPYTCTRCLQEKRCVPPDCSCCNDHMPIVETRNTPQMVFFTFDDAITPSVAKFYRQLFDSRRKNPNGCSIKMTLFVSHANTVYGLVREFYDKGMEIGVHSVSHGHPSAKTFKSEAKKQKENIAKMARVPISEIKGWRSPFLEPLGDEQPKALRELDYSYDATLTISKKNRYAAPIPFTLDYGWPYECKIKPCPRARHSGFWEIPVVALRDYLDNFDCVYVDGCHSPPPDEESAFQFLWDNFRGYYEGNRAPFGINMHASWFFYPDRLKAMDRFITKLGTLNDVYIVSMKQVIAWLKNPTPLADIESFEQWSCYNSTFAIKKRKREKQRKQEEIERKKRLMQAQANFAQRHRQWQKQVQENNRKRQRLNRHKMRNKPEAISTTHQKPRNVLRSWGSRSQLVRGGSKPKTNMRMNSQFSHPSISWQRALRQQVARQIYTRKHRNQPTAVKIVKPKKNDIQQMNSEGKQEKLTPKTDNKKPNPKTRTIEIDVIRKRPQQISNAQSNFNKSGFLQNKPPSVVTSDHQRFQLRKRLQTNVQQTKNVSDKRKFAQQQRQIFLTNELKRLRERSRLQREKLRPLRKNAPLTKGNSKVTLKKHPKSENKPQTTQRKSASPLNAKKEQISQQSGSRHGHIQGQTKGQLQQVQGHGNFKQPPIIIPKHFQQEKVQVQHRRRQRLSPTTKLQRIRLNDREKEIRQEVMLAEEESSTVQHLVEGQNEHVGTPIDPNTINNERIVNRDIIQQNLLNTNGLFSVKKIRKSTEGNVEQQKPIQGHKTSVNQETEHKKERVYHQQLLDNASQKQINHDQPELHRQFKDRGMNQNNKQVNNANNHQKPPMHRDQFIQPDQSPTTDSVPMKSTIILSGQDNVPIEDTLSTWKNHQPQPLNANDMTTMPPIFASLNTEHISDRTVINHFASQDITERPFFTTTEFSTNVRELSSTGVKKQGVQDKVLGLEYNSPQVIFNSVSELEQTASVIDSHKTNVKMDGSTTTHDPVSNVQTSPVTQIPTYQRRNIANVVFSVPGYKSLSFDTPTMNNEALGIHKKQHREARVPSDTTTAVTNGPHFNTTPKQKAISHNVNCQQEINCMAPSCLCRSQNPPGGLRKKDTPQFIYITVDGPVNFLSFSKIRSLFTRQRMNPNGCRIGGTLFLTHPGTSFGLAKRLHRDGLEIAAGSRKSTNNKILDNFKTDLMKIEKSVRRYLPDYKLQGWRNVNVKQIGYNQFEFLKNNSIYDSSLVAASDWWPYTMDIGSVEHCNAGSCSMNQDIGVWEVPLKPLVTRPGNLKCLYADGCSVQPSSSKATYEFLMDNFKQHYQASRTPFGINLNQSWFHWSNYKNIAGLSKFIDNVLQRRDVFIVSIADMLHWIKHPTPTYKINHSVPWKC